MATIQPASVGTKIDADIAAIKADVAGLKAKAVAEEQKIWTWVKGNWAHFVTWSLLAYQALKSIF
jgi:hypothetical protein